VALACSTMFLQHVRTRLDRQRNYFRIYMISHALISDSVTVGFLPFYFLAA
jgi:hypothetical protein